MSPQTNDFVIWHSGGKSEESPYSTKQVEGAVLPQQTEVKLSDFLPMEDA